MEAFFLELVKLSLIGSLFAAAVMLVRLVFPKTPKWILCLMWGVVALRLIFPVSIESKLSLVPENIASGQIITSVGDAYIGDVEIIRENDTGYRDAVDAGRQPVSSGEGYYVVTGKDSLEAPKTVAGTLYPILSWVWAAGVAAMLIYTAVSYLMLRRKMAEATRLRENIWQCEQVDSPFVLGFFKPKIYLPYTVTDSDMVNVIAHEQAHIHRRDHWWKPIGFILLSVYWFNPVLWVAYIMLCRDIEAACDEKVIKHMERDEMRAYSTALLNCSVNRRRIAACPLAFGEVGVKERVKTVMNYKKPAFWIVIAAVALCIVVAVSFLTDPKDYGPEVGNPKMLELPGVEWFVTPEEFKEALNITEDQIVSEGITPEREDVANDYDRYDLYVTDLTLYGREVSYALFEFRRDPGYDFAFDHAIVMFPEDTDMVKFRDDLEEIYGAGSREPYRYYLYYNNEKHYHETELNLEKDLRYFSQYDRFSEGLDGNPYQDALNDPDYMVHHWATENGCSVIPAEVVEWFKDAMDRAPNAEDSVLQDDEVLMEMLDQMPWVAMTISNRCVPPIRRDAEGIEDESAALYTNNYIEFSANFLANYLYEARKAAVDDPTDDTSAASEPTEDTAQSANPATLADIMASVPALDDGSMLCFPGTRWGSTPEEVKAVLNVAEEQIITDQPNGDSYILLVEDVPFFGCEVVSAEFKFIARNNEFGLATVNLYYPDGTDMSTVEAALLDLYGTPNEGQGFTRYKVSNGTVEPYSAWGFTSSFSGEGPFVMNWWESTAKRADLLPAAVQEAMIESGYLTYYMERLDPADPSTRDLILEYLNNDPAVLLYCTNGSNAGNVGFQYYTKNEVSFSALDYMIQLLYNSK